MYQNYETFHEKAPHCHLQGTPGRCATTMDFDEMFFLLAPDQVLVIWVCSLQISFAMGEHYHKVLLLKTWQVYEFEGSVLHVRAHFKHFHRVAV